MKRRILALLTAILMVTSMLPLSALAASPSVRIIVENTTFSIADGAPWEGTLVDTSVDITDGDFMMDALEALFDREDIDAQGLSSNYIYSINGLSAMMSGATGGSGWMGTQNDWFTNYGFSEIVLSDGDEIRIMYTNNEWDDGLGADLGGTWDNNDKTIKALTFSAGVLSEAFDAAIHTYTLTVPKGTTGIVVTPTATNKNFQVRTNVGATEYKRSAIVPVENGTELTVKCGDPQWPTMNMADDVPAELYTVHVVYEAEMADPFNVTVKVAPSTANASFYECAGFTEDEYDIPGTQVTAVDGGVVDSYHIYTFTVQAGTYSFRGTDVDGNDLGGMTFDVPTSVNVDGTGGSECEVVIRQFEIWTTTALTAGVYPTQNDYSVQIMDTHGKQAAVGSSYLNGNYTRYRSFLYAGGNAELYTYLLVPTQAVSDTYNLGTNVLATQTVPVANSVLTKSGTLPTLVVATINAPAVADVSVYNQVHNFNIWEVAPISVADNGDGTKNYNYKLPKSNGSHTYRVTKPGKVTKAGYMTLTKDIAYTVAFGEEEDPLARVEYDVLSPTGKYMEDNILLNINAKNYLQLKSGDTFKARAYRAAWQIVNNVTANIMIEPDFHYTILSGDSVTIRQDSEKSQWANLTAVKPGITVIEVTYDAIDVEGNGNLAGRYNAIDPARKGLIVVNVDGDTSTAIDLNIGDWDSEMDTVYFTGSSGEFVFSPTAGQPITVLCNGIAYLPESGSYTIPIVEGNNVVAVTAGDTVEYFTVKGNKVTANITNVTNPEQPIKQGDTVAINFTGLHMPAPKFAGIYNPGFGNTMKIAYNTGDGGSVSSGGTQYDFINNHTITFTVWDKGVLKLTGGTMPMTMMCDPADPWGQHRTLTDNGVGANFNASSVAGEFGIMPDLEINVLKNEDSSYLDTARSNFGALRNTEILCGPSSFTKSFYLSYTTQATASTKNHNSTFSAINAAHELTVTATPLNAGVTMEFRYWEEGDTAKHVYPLIAGQPLKLGAGLFSGNAMIHMEIAVTPIKPIYGDTMVYSYSVYKNTAGFENPILKTLNVLNSAGTAFGGSFGVLQSSNGSGIGYTQNDYTVYVPDDTSSVKLQMARVIGKFPVIVGGQSLDVALQNVIFNAIALTGDTTVLPITVNNGTYDRMYTLTIVKTTELAIQKSITNDFLQDVFDTLMLDEIGTMAQQALTQAMNTGLDKIAGAATAEDITLFRNQAYHAMDAAAETPEYTLGDVGGNGTVTEIDALMTLQASTGSITLTPVQHLAADVNRNGTVTALDALMILQFAAGLISSF